MRSADIIICPLYVRSVKSEIADGELPSMYRKAYQEYPAGGATSYEAGGLRLGRLGQVSTV